MDGLEDLTSDSEPEDDDGQGSSRTLRPHFFRRMSSEEFGQGQGQGKGKGKVPFNNGGHDQDHDHDRDRVGSVPISTFSRSVALRKRVTLRETSLPEHTNVRNVRG